MPRVTDMFEVGRGPVSVLALAVAARLPNIAQMRMSKSVSIVLASTWNIAS
jgi:hypothetical protein